jgi:hypothetical protein
MRCMVLVFAVLTTACGGGPTGPLGLVRFADREINLGVGFSGQFQLTNVGSEPLTDLSFGSESAVNADGVAVEGARLTVLSGSVGSLPPGRKISFPFRIEALTLPPGRYTLDLKALVDGEESDRTTIRFIRE